MKRVQKKTTRQFKTVNWIDCNKIEQRILVKIFGLKGVRDGILGDYVEQNTWLGFSQAVANTNAFHSQIWQQQKIK